MLAAGFDFREFGPTPEVWMPFQLDPNTTDQGHYFRVAGRLKPGVTLAQARARLQLSATSSGTGSRTRSAERRLHRRAAAGGVRQQRPLVAPVLLGAVGFVLLIACANVANLLLVRATGRRREIAIRAAIGAGRGRIIRQLLTESVVLSLAGGAVGVVVGVAGIRALLAVNTAGLPRIGQDGALVGVDWRVLAFTLVVSVGTGLVFGLIPALQGSRADLGAMLKESGGRSGTGFRQNKTRAVLVVTEVALALILLVGSALLIRTSVALAHVEPGLRRVQRADDADVADRTAVQTSAAVELLVRNAVERLARCPASRRERHLLRAARGRLRPAVQHRRPPARRPVPRRRRLADRVARLLRGVPDSRSCAAGRSRTATTARRRRS